MSERIAIGIDTSCYTTSVACVKERSIVFSKGTMLSVPFGGRGLRQSEGLFQHVKNLPELLEALFAAVSGQEISCIGVSATPTTEQDSYMPVFLAGLSQARGLASALHVPLIRLDHQSGHIRAALHTNEELLDRERFYAIHISGGTTDVLLVEPQKDGSFSIHPLGRSTDLHAGQFVDRVGVALGCSFPSGKQLEALALQATERDIKIGASVQGLNCSFSGAESRASRLLSEAPKEELAFAVYDCLARTLHKLMEACSMTHGNAPFLLCGGVASSALLRELLHRRSERTLYFGEASLSSDNAVGTAFLALERR